MTTHTKGKWKVTHHRNEVHIQTDKALLAQIFRQDEDCAGCIKGEETYANAKLIASAPELLEACKEAHQMIGEDLIDNYMTGYEDQDKHYKGLHTKLYDALIKAEGVNL